MREVLFRGKRKDNGEWVEGYLFQVFDEGFYIINDRLCSILVISETVGQYTGLTDANGKKVFEGDIVRYYGTYNLEVYIENGHTKIRWFDTVTNREESDLFFGYDEEAYGEFENVGNIYDNPELLRRK